MFYNEERFRLYNFTGSTVTKVHNWNGGLLIYGEFADYDVCRYFTLEFHHKNSEINGIEDIEIIYNISVEKSDGDYKVTVNDVVFNCYDVHFWAKEYKGFSYRNMYGTEKWHNSLESLMYLEDKKYLRDEYAYELSDGYSVNMVTYSKFTGEREIALSKETVKKSGEVIFEYCYEGFQSEPFRDFIYHSNGHRYWAFKVSLYGMSYLDVDTKEVYCYIPEGSEHDCLQLCGESFIVTDVYYDKESNLIAYDGCYWCGNDEIMVGDFSNPLDFNPHLVNIADIFDLDCDVYDGIEFREWKDGRLYFICYGEETETEESVSVEEIKNMINALTIKGEK